MIRNFTVANTEYTVSTCTAIAVTAGDTEYQPALYVVTVADSGEVFDFVVFGWKMPETVEDFADMCEDFAAWGSYYEEVGTAKFTAEEREALGRAGFEIREKG